MIKTKIKFFIAPLLLSLLINSTSADAGQFEDWQTAYERGDFKMALSLLQPLADKGDPEAEYQLGEMYIIGAGVKQDTSIANQWYDKAVNEFRKRAEQGDARAQYMTGQLYALGRGDKKIDRAEAFKLYQKAADQGYAPAQFEVGTMYMVQKGSLRVNYNDAINHSDVEAMKWFQKAAAQGNADAEFYIGEFYGFGGTHEDKNAEIKQNFDEADKWVHRAAEDGSIEAQMTLGTQEYIYGWNNTKKNGDEAVRLFEKVANQPMLGDNARCSLGRIYEIGSIVPQDYAKAYMWDSLCALGRFQLKHFESKMTKSQIDNGKKLQQEWLSTHAGADTWLKVNAAEFATLETNSENDNSLLPAPR